MDQKNSFLKRIKAFKRPLWLQWSWFPKDGAPPTLSILEVIVYLLVFLLCGYLFWKFNEIPYNKFIINVDKLTNVRHITKKDTTFQLHFQVADVVFKIPRHTLNPQDTIEIFHSLHTQDSIMFYIPNGISDPIKSYISCGLSPYWCGVVDNYAKYCEYEEVRILAYNHWHNKCLHVSELNGMLSNHEAHRFPSERLKVSRPIDWKHRYYYGLAVSTNDKEEKVQQWIDSIVDNHHFITNRQEIKKENGAYYHYLNSYSATDNNQDCTHNHLRIWPKSRFMSTLSSTVSIEPPGWFELYDISQGWYEIKLNTTTIDSIALTIDFIGATDFYPMKIEPDEKGGNYIKYTNPIKILQIRKEGLKLYAQFKELESRQTIRCFAVTAILSGLLIVLITFFIMGVYRAPRIIRKTARYDDMQRWFAYQRRHKANVFDVFFKDMENISDENIVPIIKEAARYFQLPVPVILNTCETIAKIMTSENGAECEIYYDWELMKKVGINNTDTLRLSIIHELSHQVLYETHFLLFENELWIQELAADMMVGAFSAIGDDVATGKYKYVLRQLPASLTHPDGKLRADIVEYGREYITRLRRQGEVDDIKEVLKGLPAFVYAHYQELQESWSKVQLDDGEEDIPKETTPMDYEALPDTNLLKQYYLKHKERKEDDI